MAYELTGKVKLIQAVQTFGSGFTKREMVVVVQDGKYPQEINLEFVQDKETKRTFDPARKVHLEVYAEGKKLGLILLPSVGCDRGHAGDMALIGPPLIITREQVDELVEILDKALTEVEKRVHP